MKRRSALIIGFSVAALLGLALSAEAGGIRFSFGFSFGIGGGHHVPYGYYFHSPGYIPYVHRGYYYGPSYYYGPPVTIYYTSPYRYRVYRSYSPYSRRDRGYVRYEPRRYYRRR